MINQILTGDCKNVLRTLINHGVRVQCVVTSPPYWGLRDYGVAGQLGLEATLDEYVNSLVDVFGLVYKLLADDGICWLNLGDSYTGSAASGGVSRSKSLNGPSNAERPGCGPSIKRVPKGLKSKELCGVPWRVAFALQANGWYLRQDIVWSKPNPMPESVRDRCTRAHEYLFMFTKRPRYYYDFDAISEDTKSVSGIKRNRRSVWHIAPQPYNGAHFAVMPDALVEPCILCSTKPNDLVFYPFMGSGTVAAVAARLDRKWLGVELNAEYAELARKRASSARILRLGL